MPPLETLYKQIDLPAESASKLASYFQEQVMRGVADRADLEDKWERAHELFEGQRPPKNHPWPGCSNIHIPMVASHVVAIHARFMTTLFAPEPFWRVRARNPDHVDFAKAATEYLDWARQNMFKWYEPIRDFSLDAINPGLGVLKITWRKREGKVYRYDKDYNIVEDKAVIEDRPHVESISPDKFVWPAGYDNIQTCPWIAHIIDYTPADLRRLAAEGFYRKPGVRLALGAETLNERDDLDQTRDEHEGLIPSMKPTVRVYDVWGRYDVNGDGIEEEVNAVIEPTTGAILRLNPNPYFHRKRPFVIGRLEPRAHRIAGLSVTDQIGDLNEEINTVHNQTIDAATVSICQMFSVRAGSPAEAALDQIWPGKKIPRSLPDDIQELSFGPLKTNSVMLEELARVYSERRTGISDFAQGREPSASRRGTATGTLAIIQEGNKKFDFQIRDMREGLAEAGMMLLSLFQQMNPAGIIQDVLGPEDSAAFASIIMRFPDIPLENAISIEVVAGTSTVNRQVQRQDALSLFQLMMSFYQQALQMGQLLSTPGLPPPFIELAIKLATSSKVMLADVLQSFEERRVDELIPDLEEIYAQIGTIGLMQGNPLAPGMANSPGGAQAPRGPGGGGGAPGRPGPGPAVVQGRQSPMAGAP
jgi:hypothetical protein